MNTKNKILVLGDLHYKDFLSYSEYFDDKREEERNKILDTIVESSQDCAQVVMLGDIFNSRNNTSRTNRALVNFLERFDNKELFLLSGNHDANAEKTTAIDFLREIKGKNWHVITKDIYEQEDLVFVPYFFSSELGEETNEDASKSLMKKLEKFKDKDRVLFAHHATSDTKIGFYDTNLFNEVLLNKKNVKSIFRQVFCGHLHSPSQDDNLLYTGSIFCQEVGDENKKIYKYDGESVEEICLPGRNIYKLECPPDEALELIPRNSIIKIYINKRDYKLNRELLDTFDTVILREAFEEERKVEKDRVIDLRNISVDKLLEIYSKDKGVSMEKLKRGYELLNV